MELVVAGVLDCFRKSRRDGGDEGARPLLVDDVHDVGGARAGVDFVGLQTPSSFTYSVFTMTPNSCAV